MTDDQGEESYLARQAQRGHGCAEGSCQAAYLSAFQYVRLRSLYCAVDQASNPIELDLTPPPERARGKKQGHEGHSTEQVVLTVLKETA